MHPESANNQRGEDDITSSPTNQILFLRVSYNGSTRAFQAHGRGSIPLTRYMVSKGKIYVVTMYRWGNRENHSYLLSVWSKKQKALDECKKEEDYRGGKYMGEIIEMELDSELRDEDRARKTIKKLGLHPIFQ